MFMFQLLVFLKFLRPSLLECGVFPACVFTVNDSRDLWRHTFSICSHSAPLFTTGAGRDECRVPASAVLLSELIACLLTTGSVFARHVAVRYRH